MNQRTGTGPHYYIRPRIQVLAAYMALIQVEDICNEENYAEPTILTQEKGDITMTAFQYGFPTTGDMIRSARCHVGWSREELALQAGVSIAALQNIEKGANDPSADTLEKLVRALNAERVVLSKAASGKFRCSGEAPMQLRHKGKFISETQRRWMEWEANGQLIEENPMARCRVGGPCWHPAFGCPDRRCAGQHCPGAGDAEPADRAHPRHRRTAGQRENGPSPSTVRGRAVRGRSAGQCQN
jgi:transcriptional regulator with XRE-family HTH domain